MTRCQICFELVALLSVGKKPQAWRVGGTSSSGGDSDAQAVGQLFWLEEAAREAAMDFFCAPRTKPRVPANYSSNLKTIEQQPTRAEGPVGIFHRSSQNP